MSNFLNSRPRRNRKSPWIRELLAETRLHSSDLIMPFFVIEGKNKKEAIKTLPNQFRFSIDLLIKEIRKARDLGIPAIMLFPATNPKLKTADGREALNADNLICQAVRAIKKQVPEIGVICDVALDPYTSHGHDGLLGKDGLVLNDQTIEILCKQALVQAKAGCDIVAPSDMMDGRVGEIRKYLDQHGFENIGIMSYAAKYASNFYGAFRNAIGSDKNLSVGDKKNYQMDFRNCAEAIREINLDVAEGADMLIIKPGLPYLDIVAKAKQICNLPIISYQVSSEYAMLKLAAKEGILDFDAGLYETLIAFKRAGATAIITYGAMEIAAQLKHASN
ncbi:MAG: porphobilinogen synthase [Pseudomonadota bacterium]